MKESPAMNEINPSDSKQSASNLTSERQDFVNEVASSFQAFEAYDLSDKDENNGDEFDDKVFGLKETPDLFASSAIQDRSNSSKKIKASTFKVGRLTVNKKLQSRAKILEDHLVETKQADQDFSVEIKPFEMQID